MSIVLAAYRDNLIAGAIKDNYSFAVWDYFYFAITSVFLLDLVLNLLAYGADLFTKLVAYRLEMFI